MRRSLVALVASFVSACAQTPAKPTAAAPAFAYPPAPRGEVADTYNGVRVSDPYRWLEELDSEQTQRWAAAENALTDHYFQNVSGREALATRLAALSSHETFGLPVQRGSHVFWTHNDGKQAQSVLLSAGGIDQPSTVLVDPTAVSPDGKLGFAGYVTSRDGERVAYGMSEGGGDWQRWNVVGAPAGEQLEHIKYYPPAFAPDGKGLYYSRFPAPAPGKELAEADHDCKVYFHRIGTPASQDSIVYERPDHPTWQFAPLVTLDGRALLIQVGDGEVGDRGQEQLVYLNLERPGAKPVSLIDVFDAEYLVVGSDGYTLFVQTSLAAPTKKIIAIDLRRSDRSRWKDIVPAGQEAIVDAAVAGHQLFVTRLKDAQTVVTAYDLTGKKLRDVALPGIGSAYGFSGTPEARETFYYFTGFTTPGSVYRYDIASGQSTIWKAPSLPFDASSIEVKQVFYPSKDGTQIPMFILSRKGAALDGKNPTLLTGYGGFGIPLTPWFDPDSIPWLERGGVVAVANLRGGGEYGEAWHEAGRRTRKQNVFDDFIAAGEWLIQNHYTSHEHLGIFGTSNGGLLIGAVLVQRPDLWGAANPRAGVLDMLRFPLFGEGSGWQGDYGSPQDPAEFKALFAYSPVHNVRPGTRFPPTLVVTADHDVRVAPLHSYKFAAAMQAAQAGDAPVLLRVETTSGHGGGTTRKSRVDQAAEFLAFFAKNLGLPLQ